MDIQKQFRQISYYGVVIILLFVMQFAYVIVLADANANHYTEVQQDIWSFTKYILVAFCGLIVWGLKEFVSSIRGLTNTVSGLKTELALNNNKVEDIKEDVNFMRRDIESHNARINTLEKTQQN